MKYFSTKLNQPSNKENLVSAKQAVLQGLADDRGLFMPQTIPMFEKEFINNLASLDLQSIAVQTAKLYFSEDIGEKEIIDICRDAFNFSFEIKNIEENIHVLELFHGPTCAFKDVGARFMSRIFEKFRGNSKITILTATSGDTGSAVASGFHNVEGVDVYILYPQGKVSKIQEQQLTTYGGNIHAIEIKGTFDDCQRLVKDAFMDKELKAAFQLSSANSINIARFLPQSIYYTYACSWWMRTYNKSHEDALNELVISVPSGNFGNLTAGLFAKTMGVPIKRFIASTNANDIVVKFLEKGDYNPKPSIETIANAMDVGDPSNFPRIMELFENSLEKIKDVVEGVSLNDEGIRSQIKDLYERKNYILDPHGAVGYYGMKEKLDPSESGIFLETAHPAKFPETVESVLNIKLDTPERLKVFLDKEKKSKVLSKSFNDFKGFLLETI